MSFKSLIHEFWENNSKINVKILRLMSKFGEISEFWDKILKSDLNAIILGLKPEFWEKRQFKDKCKKLWNLIQNNEPNKTNLGLKSKFWLKKGQNSKINL